MKIQKFLLWILLLGTFCSCQNVAEPIDLVAKTIVSKEKLFDTSVSVEEAKNVAELFKAKYDPQTRSCKSVKEVLTIRDKANKPSMYIVNYANEQGFLLISATKNFQPILAYADKGNLNIIGDLPDGLSNWLGNMKAIIEVQDEMPCDSTFRYRTMWEHYLLANDEKTYTRSSLTEFENYIATCCKRWRSEGYAYIPFAGARDYLPEGIYERFRNVAESMTYIEYDYNQHAYLRWKQNGREDKMENFLSTTWNQQSGFNVALPPINGQYPPAGCATIAMAQVMKHYEYPIYFNWNAMPNSFASSITAAFIRDIADAIHADYALDGTGASLTDVRNAFVSKYGYSSKAQVVSHAVGIAEGELRKKRPVIMQGFTDDGKTGHGWIACGYHDIDYYTEYELMVMPEEYYPGDTFIFMVADSYIGESDNRMYFYMNWGWGGSYDGMYLDSNLFVDRTDGRFSWNRNRKDIIGIAPN